MSGVRKGFALQAATAAAPAIPADVAAQRLGVSRDELQAMARKWFLEPTYSIAEVAAYFGLGKWAVSQLVELGRRHGAALHPTRGGLYPTFKPSHKSRRIPLSAIERHQRHMARAQDPVAALAGE